MEYEELYGAGDEDYSDFTENLLAKKKKLPDTDKVTDQIREELKAQIAAKKASGGAADTFKSNLTGDPDQTMMLTHEVIRLRTLVYVMLFMYLFIICMVTLLISRLIPQMGSSITQVVTPGK